MAHFVAHLSNLPLLLWLNRQGRPTFNGITKPSDLVNRGHCDIGKYSAWHRSSNLAIKRLSDRAIPPSTGNVGLNKHKPRSAPHDQWAGRTRLRGWNVLGDIACMQLGAHRQRTRLTDNWTSFRHVIGARRQRRPEHSFRSAIAHVYVILGFSATREGCIAAARLRDTGSETTLLRSSGRGHTIGCMCRGHPRPQ